MKRSFDLSMEDVNSFKTALKRNSYTEEYLNIKLKKDKNIQMKALICLFYLGMPVKKEEINSIWNEKTWRRFVNHGILNINNNDLIHSQIMIVPYKQYYFASDFLIRYKYFSSKPKIMTKNDLVYPISDDSIDIFKAVIKRNAISILDLCSGCGSLSILSSKYAKKVTGVDINPRAVDIANFNLLLNNVKNVEFKIGNLYEQLGQERYDLILANPPFIISLGKKDPIYKNGGADGYKVTRKIIREIHDHLKVKGCCQIITYLYEDGTKKYKESLIKNFLGKNNNFSCIFLNLKEEDIYHFIRFHILNVSINKTDQSAKTFLSILKQFDVLKIKKVSYGIIYLFKSNEFSFIEKKTIVFNSN